MLDLLDVDSDSAELCSRIATFVNESDRSITSSEIFDKKETGLANNY